MRGNTGTGEVLEQTVLPALRRGRYRITRQADIGQRPDGGKHIIDVLAERIDGQKHLISLKWQQVSGTAEQKIPYEVICLADAVYENTKGYLNAYLVIAGPGWTLKEYYLRGGLLSRLNYFSLVELVDLETFISLANRGAL